MKYMDRNGKAYSEITSQDRFLEVAYSSKTGRILLKFLSLPVFSKAIRYIMNSRISTVAIPSFVEKNHIDLFDYEQKVYTSFNDFFTRKIKKGRRFVTADDNILVSPCDGKVSAYEITNSDSFVIKNSVYTVESLLRDKKLARRYKGGIALVIRLSVENYHRYIYPCNGVKSHDRVINGFLQTVNPVVNEHYPVYKENTREYCLIRSENFGDIVQMEVGALMVGRISNNCKEKKKVHRGEEKGFFEFGGSTIVLLLEKDKVRLSPDFVENTKKGYETKVIQGEALGCKF